MDPFLSRCMTTTRWMGAIALALSLAGCATIMHGSRQSIGIGSSPTGARVLVDKQLQGTTPVVAKLSRKDDHLVRLELDGYEPFETNLTRKISGWVLGNIVLVGLIGLTVDGITGGLYQLTPEQIQAEMKKVGVSMRLDQDMILITVTLQPQPNWTKVGQLQPEPTH